MAHPLVHAADQNQERRMRRQSEIAEDREPEGKGDRHAGKHRGGDHADEEDQEIEIAEPQKYRPGEPRTARPARQWRRATTAMTAARRSATGAAPQRRSSSAMPAGMRGGAPRIGDFKRRGRDRQLIDARIDRSATRSAGEMRARRPSQRCRAPRAQRLRQHADTGRHAHVLVAAERDDRAEHRQPQEQRRGKLVRPDQRPVEHVTRHDAREQDQRSRRQPGPPPRSRRTSRAKPRQL